MRGKDSQEGGENYELVHVLLYLHTLFHIILVLVSTSWLSDVTLPLLLSGRTQKIKRNRRRQKRLKIIWGSSHSLSLSLYG